MHAGRMVHAEAPPAMEAWDEQRDAYLGIDRQYIYLNTHI